MDSDRVNILNKTDLKQCRMCKKILPVEAFSNNVREKDGLQIYCRGCNIFIISQEGVKCLRL